MSSPWHPWTHFRRTNGHQDSACPPSRAVTHAPSPAAWPRPHTPGTPNPAPTRSENVRGRYHNRRKAARPHTPLCASLVGTAGWSPSYPSTTTAIDTPTPARSLHVRGIWFDVFLAVPYQPHTRTRARASVLPTRPRCPRSQPVRHQPTYLPTYLPINHPTYTYCLFEPQFNCFTARSGLWNLLYSVTREQQTTAPC